MARQPPSTTTSSGAAASAPAARDWAGSRSPAWASCSARAASMRARGPHRLGRDLLQRRAQERDGRIRRGERRAASITSAVSSAPSPAASTSPWAARDSHCQPSASCAARSARPRSAAMATSRGSRLGRLAQLAHRLGHPSGRQLEAPAPRVRARPPRRLAARGQHPAKGVARWIAPAQPHQRLAQRQPGVDGVDRDVDGATEGDDGGLVVAAPGPHLAQRGQHRQRSAGGGRAAPRGWPGPAPARRARRRRAPPSAPDRRRRGARPRSGSR
jgi:hypothetical protein